MKWTRARDRLDFDFGGMFHALSAFNVCYFVKKNKTQNHIKQKIHSIYMICGIFLITYAGGKQITSIDNNLFHINLIYYHKHFVCIANLSNPDSIHSTQK